MNYLHRNKAVVAVLGLLVLYTVSVLINLGTLELAGEEPRRAMVSLDMLQSGNFIKPTLFGWDYYNKPPVFNWILSGAILLTGSASEAVLRLPSLLFYLLLAFFHYRISLNFFPKRIALLSSFFLLTSGDIYFYGLANGAEIDIFYSLVVYLQTVSIFWFYTKRRYLELYLVSFLFCGLGFLTKGFPSLLFQGLTLAALCLYARSVKIIWRWQFFIGILFFIAAVGLYALLYSRSGSPARFFVNLLNEAFIKSAVGERSHKLLDKSLIYPLLLLQMAAPWSLLLLLLFKKIKYNFRQNPLVWFSILFIVCNIWVYWFTGQPKMRYVYMFVPYSCTVFAQVYCRFTEEYQVVFNKLLKYLGLFFGLALLGVVALPFFETVSVTGVVCIVIALIVFLYYYMRISSERIWLFIAGIVLLRFVYAVLIIPIQYKYIESYHRQMAKAAVANGKAPLRYWAKALTFPVSVSNKLFTYELETITIPPVIPYQIPYYYYLNTGEIMKYDTAQSNAPCLISFASQLQGQTVDTIYSFFDKTFNEPVVFYSLKNQD
ncbi:MAG TPA: glycosyltransferase family 39 protein [Flavisolibacter sp.]|nr:glycosyltransferase family 39 protein [Flavisolibacter sp.]